MGQCRFSVERPASKLEPIIALGSLWSNAPLTPAGAVGHRYLSDRRFSVAQDSAPEARETLSFEQILAQLSQVVERLEAGEIPLEQALLTFEQGVALSRLGAKRLDEAERRIEVLLRDDQGLALRPMAEERDDE